MFYFVNRPRSFLWFNLAASLFWLTEKWNTLHGGWGRGSAAPFVCTAGIACITTPSACIFIFSHKHWVEKNCVSNKEKNR